MALDWANERFVRLYTRETPDQAAWSWQARALWPWLLAKVDGAGVIETRGAKGLAATVRLPIEVVEEGLHGEDGLVADGCVVVTPRGFAIRNYYEAQNTRSTPDRRQAAVRERDRALAALTAAAASVTPATEVSQPVTAGHAESQSVTPSRAEPSRDSLSGPAGARDPSPPVPVPVPAPRPTLPGLVLLAVELLNAERVRISPEATTVAADPGDEMAAAGHLRGMSDADRERAIRHGVAVIAARVEAELEPFAALRPGELFGPRAWRKYQADDPERIRSRSARGRAAPPGRPPPPKRGLSALLDDDPDPEPDP